MFPNLFRQKPTQRALDKTFKNAVIFYHEQCQDGEVANVCAVQGLRDRGYTLSIQSIGRSYQKSFSLTDSKGDLLPELVGALILYVDFAPMPVELSVVEKVSLAVVLDHHETARKMYDIKSLNTETIYDCFERTTGRIMILDNSRSGAGISWDFFNPYVTRPDLVNLIEDRDLWKFKFKGSRELALYIQNNPPENWGKFFNRFNNSDVYQRRILRASETFYEEVQAIISYQSQNSKLHQVSESVSFRTIEYSNHHSDLGNKILEDFPDIAFAVIVVHKGPGKYKLSFRSSDSRMSVSTLCERFGGGGHRNAAGLNVDLLDGETIDQRIMDMVTQCLSNGEK